MKNLHLVTIPALTLLFCFFYSIAISQTRDTTLNRLFTELENKDIHDTIKVKALNEIAFYYITSPHINIKKATNYNDRCLEFAKKIDFISGIAAAYNIYAIIESRNGNYSASLNYYQKSIRNFEKINKKKSIAVLLRNMALMYKNNLSDNDMALKYKVRAHNIYLNLQDTIGMIKTYSELSLMFFNNFNQKNKGRRYIEHALNLAIAKNDEALTATTYMTFCNFLDYKTQIKKITEYISKAIFIYQKNNDLYNLGLAHFNLGYYLCQGGNYTESIVQTKKALKNWESEGRTGMVVLSYDGLEEIYSKKGDYKNAYYYREIKDSINEILLNETTKKNISELEIKYETEKKEQENKILKRNQIIEKQKARLKDSMIWSITIGSVLAFLIITLAFLKYRQKKLSEEREALLQIEKFGKEIDILQTTINSRIESSEKINSSPVNFKEINSSLSEPLSEREFEILKELSKGKSNQEIADNLFISINTVKTHLMKTYAKLDVKNRIQAIKKVMK